MAWKVKKGTRAVNQYFTIKEYISASGYVAKNISGYSVRVNANDRGTPLFSGVLTVASSSLGYTYYTIQSGDFAYATNADYELVLEKDNELVPTETYPLQVGRRPE